MASSLGLRRLLTSNLLPKSLSASIRPIATTTPYVASRFFNSHSAARRHDEDDSESDSDFDPRFFRGSRPRRREAFFSDAFVPPFPPSWNQMTGNPFVSAARGVGAAGLRLGWEARETENALHLRADMPGLGKEDVKVSVEDNALVIKGGEAGKEVGDDEASEAGMYNSRIQLPEKLFKVAEIKAEMKNGVLKVVVPKLKEEERKDVIHVKVE